MNYFLSVWIANFGVDPLLLLEFLRFVPTFDLLALLLFSVTFVRETILKLLQKNLNSLFGEANYTNLVWVVKSFLFCIAFLPQTSQAQENSFFLSPGEAKEITVTGLENYLVGNGEVISVKAQKNGQRILIKAKMQGYSNLVVWEKEQKKKIYEIFVTKKRGKMDLILWQKYLGPLQLQVSLGPHSFQLKGKIERLEQYQKFSKFLSTQNQKIDSEIEVSEEVQKAVLGEIYQFFFAKDYTRLTCEFRQHNIACQVPYKKSKFEKFIPLLKFNYPLQFVYTQGHDVQNLKLSYKIIQIENTNGDEFSLGLDSLTGAVSELFSGGLKSVLYRNQWFIKQYHLDISTLAEPEIIAGIGHDSLVELGSETPFDQTDGQKSGLQWKFAGLRVKSKVTNENDQYQLTYQSQFTHPIDKTISGSKGKATVSMSALQPVLLFQISFRSISKNDQRFPILSQIPILGALFYAKHNSQNFKKVQVYLCLEELP